MQNSKQVSLNPSIKIHMKRRIDSQEFKFLRVHEQNRFSLNGSSPRPLIIHSIAFRAFPGVPEGRIILKFCCRMSLRSWKFQIRSMVFRPASSIEITFAGNTKVALKRPIGAAVLRRCIRPNKKLQFRGSKWRRPRKSFVGKLRNNVGKGVCHSQIEYSPVLVADGERVLR